MSMAKKAFSRLPKAVRPIKYHLRLKPGMQFNQMSIEYSMQFSIEFCYIVKLIRKLLKILLKFN